MDYIRAIRIIDNSIRSVSYFSSVHFNDINKILIDNLNNLGFVKESDALNLLDDSISKEIRLRALTNVRNRLILFLNNEVMRNNDMIIFQNHKSGSIFQLRYNQIHSSPQIRYIINGIFLPWVDIRSKDIILLLSKSYKLCSS